MAAPAAADGRLAQCVLTVLAGRKASGSAATPAAVSAQTRGQVDAQAVWQRFSQASLHTALAPVQPLARRLHDACEHARCQALGVARWPGMAANLARRPAGDWPGHDLPPKARQWLCALHGALGIPLPQGVAASPLDSLPLALAALRTDQRAFALGCHAALRQWLAVVEDMPVAVPPAPQPAPSPARSAPTLIPMPSAGEARRLRAQRRATLDVLHRVAAQPRGRAQVPQVSGAAAATGYAVYCRDHDVVQRADQVCSAGQLQALQQQLSRLTAQHTAHSGAAARQLQRQLLAQRPLRWQGDADDGVLDPARLAAVLTDPLRPVRLRRRRDEAAADTQVTLLIDNSGSLRGKPIELAAACAHQLVGMLERCGVRSEVLGYTTVGWRGGQAAAQWRAAGSPPAPGRLAVLRHLVYKAAGDSAARGQRQLSALLQADLLRENIDGEAVQWAMRRLARSPVRRRILLVLCDGLPQDQATLAANGPDYLLAHLQQVVARSRQQGVEAVVAVGLGREVTQGFARAVVVDDLSQLEQVLPRRLAAALCRRSAA